VGGSVTSREYDRLALLQNGRIRNPSQFYYLQPGVQGLTTPTGQDNTAATNQVPSWVPAALPQGTCSAGLPRNKAILARGHERSPRHWNIGGQCRAASTRNPFPPPPARHSLAQVVGFEVEAELAAIAGQRREGGASDLAVSFMARRSLAFGDESGLAPEIDCLFDPGGNRHRAQAAVLTAQIDDRPAAIPLLDVIHV
jgi:hypothetical protein